MKNDEFKLAWPDSCDLEIGINWTKPAPYDLLFSGGMGENDTAYFYSIVSIVAKKWIPFYIGMTHSQSASVRNGQIDHLKRLESLQKKHKKNIFSITLGTPQFPKGTRITNPLIGTIEGLLIYSNWSDLMVNKKKTQRFSASKQIYIRNEGWSEHLATEIAYGVFKR